jgi:hypothetical protein
MTDPALRRMFGTLVAAAFVDGILSDQEKQVLHRKATEMGIPVGLMKELISRGERGELPVAVPPSQKEKEDLFDRLIDVACADGRVEAPEYHLLAKFAGHLGLGLPDVRARVRRRMEARPPEPPRIKPPQIEEVRVSVEPASSIRLAPPPPEQSRIRPPHQEEAYVGPGPEATIHQATPPPPPPAPPIGSPVADIPPVTLQLIKQAISFETETDAVHYIERMLGITTPEARRIMQQVLSAFPDLQPGGRRIDRKR